LSSRRRSLAASSRRCADTASNGFVCRSERSARRARSSGAPARLAAPKLAWTSGANCSISGHMMITSRGSSVGSAINRCSTASRTTSTWRARPWHEWARKLSSLVDRTGRGSPAPAGPARPGGALSARISAWMRPSKVEGGPSTGRCSPPVTPWAASTSCISRASRPQERSSGLDGDRTVVSCALAQPAAGATNRLDAIFSHRAPEGWSKKRCTSR